MRLQIFSSLVPQAFNLFERTLLVIVLLFLFALSQQQVFFSLLVFFLRSFHKRHVLSDALASHRTFDLALFSLRVVLLGLNRFRLDGGERDASLLVLLLVHLFSLFDRVRSLLQSLLFAQQVRRLPAFDLQREGSITLGTRLVGAEGLSSLGELLQAIGDARQDRLGVFHGSESFAASRIQTPDSRSFFDQLASFDGLRLDKSRNPSLRDDRRGIRAQSDIGTQRLHLARQRFLAVDAIGRAPAAFDAPRKSDPAFTLQTRQRMTAERAVRRAIGQIF